MTPPFSVHTTPHFDRSLKKLIKRHPNLGDRYAEAIEMLNIDPQNLSRTHNIRKLEGVQRGEGPYRLRLGRWRFRYDIFGHEVWLFQCSLRREETYR
jgi:mRNA-degrading endonuclease RelE of RelBE toxin-antitoxin system